MDYDSLRNTVQLVEPSKQYRKLYVCSPLSAPTDEGIRANMYMAQHYVNEVMQYTDARAIAPHAWLPHLLDDNNPDERALGLEFGMKLLETCDGIVVCSKRISNGMRGEIERAMQLCLPILFLEDFE
jgi:hypothetical protein